MFDVVITTLLVAGAVSIVVGLSFAAVAVAVGRMDASQRWAVGAYCTWWAALAFYLVVQGALTVAAAFGSLEAATYSASRLVMVPVLCLAVWGITSYLLFVYTGGRWVFPVAGAFYTLVAAAFYFATVTASGSVEVQAWLISIDDSSPVYRIVYLAIGLPPILAAIAYLALLGKAPGRAKRYRIVLVSGSILAYVGSGLVARLFATDLVIFITLVLFGGLAAVAALLAFYPPPPVQRWLVATRQDKELALRRRNEQRRQRLIELV